MGFFNWVIKIKRRGEKGKWIVEGDFLRVIKPWSNTESFWRFKSVIITIIKGFIFVQVC